MGAFSNLSGSNALVDLTITSIEEEQEGQQSLWRLNYKDKSSLEFLIGQKTEQEL